MRGTLVQAAHDTAHPEVVLYLERWVVKSCDTVTSYQVLLTPTAGGGTDVIVRREG